MNQTTLAGHLGADPEVRFTSSGQKVTTLRLACRGRRSSKDKDRDDTIWWRVSVWGEQFDKMIAYLKKGSPLIAVGEMNKPEIFTDRDGRPQISMSMTAYHLGFSPFGKPDSQSTSHATPTTATSSETVQALHEVLAPAGESAFGEGKGAQGFSDDEIPF